MEMQMGSRQLSKALDMSEKGVVPASLHWIPALVEEFQQPLHVIDCDSVKFI
jgi:hypothetical protein